VFALNLDLLGLKIQDAETLALSHAHYDHTGGLKFVLSQKKNLKIYAHSDLFQPRYSLREGEYHSIGITITQEELSQCAELYLSREPQKILPNLWTTGEISSRPEVEGRSPHHFTATCPKEFFGTDYQHFRWNPPPVSVRSGITSRCRNAKNPSS